MLCMGIPAHIYAGNAIRPPPPAIASTKPAIKTSGQSMKSVFTANNIYNQIYIFI